MDVVVTGRHCEISDRFRAHAAEKLTKLEKHDHRIIRVHVEVDCEPNPRQHDQSVHVELTAISKGPVIRAEASADEDVPRKMMDAETVATCMEDVPIALRAHPARSGLRGPVAERRRAHHREGAKRRLEEGDAARRPAERADLPGVHDVDRGLVRRVRQRMATARFAPDGREDVARIGIADSGRIDEFDRDGRQRFAGLDHRNFRLLMRRRSARCGVDPAGDRIWPRRGHERQHNRPSLQP